MVLRQLMLLEGFEVIAQSPALIRKSVGKKLQIFLNNCKIIIINNNYHFQIKVIDQQNRL